MSVLAAGGDARAAVAVVFAPLLKQTLNQPLTRKPTLATARRVGSQSLDDGEVTEHRGVGLVQASSGPIPRERRKNGCSVAFSGSGFM